MKKLFLVLLVIVALSTGLSRYDGNRPKMFSCRWHDCNNCEIPICLTGDNQCLYKELGGILASGKSTEIRGRPYGYGLAFQAFLHTHS